MTRTPEKSGAARRIAPLVAALGLAGCVSMQAGSDYYPSADFTHFRTFAWIADSPLITPTSSRVEVSPLNLRRIEEAIETDLETKGYTEVASRDTADFAVSFTVGARDMINVDSYPPYYRGTWRWRAPYFGRNVDVYMYTEGTLAVDVFDNETRQPVWHGWAKKRITGADVRDPAATIQAAVRAILEDFPRSGEAAGEP